MKIAIIYDSKTDNTKQAACWIAEGMAGVEGIEAKTFFIHEVDDEFVDESKGLVIGSPSYSAQMTPDIRSWLFELGRNHNLGGKLGGAFATEQYTHGGGELVIQSILTTELAYGMLCYSGGGACGQPVIHIGPIGVNGNREAHNSLDIYRDYFVVYGKRFAEMAAELFK